MKYCILGIRHNKNTVVLRKIIPAAVFEPPGKEFHHLFNLNKNNQHFPLKSTLTLVNFFQMVNKVIIIIIIIILLLFFIIIIIIIYFSYISYLFNCKCL